MLTISYAPGDKALAERIGQDLQKQGQELNATLSKGAGNLLILLVSPESNADRTVQNTLIQACDNSQHIIPVLAKTAPLPKFVDHLQAVDFSSSYNLNTLVEQIKVLSAPDIKPPLRVRTPKTIASNRGYGYALTILAIAWFIIGIVLVGFGGIQAPREEYNTIDTEVAATIAVAVHQNLPRTTEEAENFPSTLQAVPSPQRPLLIASATAMVATRPPRTDFGYGG